MAHSALHFSVGFAVGTAILLVAGRRRVRSGEKKHAMFLGGLILVSYFLGVVAVIPNIFRAMGAPEHLCSGWWMNIFFFHPLIDKIKEGGMFIGSCLIAVMFFIQYAVLLVALRRRSTKL